MHESERMSEMKREIKSKTVLGHWCERSGGGGGGGVDKSNGDDARRREVKLQIRRWTHDGEVQKTESF